MPFTRQSTWETNQHKLVWWKTVSFTAMYQEEAWLALAASLPTEDVLMETLTQIQLGGGGMLTPLNSVRMSDSLLRRRLCSCEKQQDWVTASSLFMGYQCKECRFSIIESQTSPRLQVNTLVCPEEAPCQRRLQSGGIPAAVSCWATE